MLKECKHLMAHQAYCFHSQPFVGSNVLYAQAIIKADGLGDVAASKFHLLTITE
jgi:hypothetical protein